MKRLILITGSAGSGKTTLADVIGRELGYPCINVGDELAAALKGEGVSVRSREQIGPAFFDHFSLDDYLRIVRTIALPGRVIDGVRLARAVGEVKNVGTTVQFHRLQAPGHESTAEGDMYGGEVRALCEMANYIIEWQPTVGQLVRAFREEHLERLLS